MFRTRRSRFASSMVLMLVLVIAVLGCKGGGSGSGGTAVSYTIGGTISGLNGTVVLQNNGGDNLTTTASPFTFATSIADGATYSVTVLIQPSGQTCAVASGSGMVSGANVTSVSVSCTAATVSVDTSAVLTWDAPTTDADGNPLTELTGYKVHYGTTSGSYSTTLDVGLVTACTYTVTALTPGTYYFVITAYNSSGESAYSNEGSKVIQ